MQKLGEQRTEDYSCWFVKEWAVFFSFGNSIKLIIEIYVFDSLRTHTYFLLSLLLRSQAMSSTVVIDLLGACSFSHECIV